MTDEAVELGAIGKPASARRKTLVRRWAREGSIGRRIFDVILAIAILTTVVSSMISSSGTPKPPTGKANASGLAAEFVSGTDAGAALSVTAQDSSAAVKALSDRAMLNAWTKPGSATISGTSGQNAATHKSVTFGCNVPADHFCSFALFRGDGTRQILQLIGGRQMAISAIPDQDRYIVAVDSPAPEALDQCPQVQASGHFCKIALTRRGYNN